MAFWEIAFVYGTIGPDITDQAFWFAFGDVLAVVYFFAACFLPIPREVVVGLFQEIILCKPINSKFPVPSTMLLERLIINDWKVWHFSDAARNFKMKYARSKIIFHSQSMRSIDFHNRFEFTNKFFILPFSLRIQNLLNRRRIISC